tara:strand:- start:124 stop:1464 length:1341 start_codon:yes stop_codon:yes gene_type:complete
MGEYKKYKSTNYQWVGDIPDHWDCNRIGRTTYVKGRIGWKGLRSEDFLDEGPYLITGTDFDNGSINWSTCYRVDEERYAEDPFIIIQNDDVLITKDGSIGKIAHVRETKGPSTLNSGIFVTRPLNEKYLQRYFYWIVSSSLFSQFIEYNSSGSTILHLYQNVFERFFFPLPTIPEQKLISEYLNKKTKQIDCLIEKIEKKIDLLYEQKNALINQFITKGINPNEEMKNSGVDWIGEIPFNWKRIKIKNIVSIKISDGPHETPKFEEFGVPFISAEGIVHNKINFNSKRGYISHETHKLYSKKCVPLRDDVLIVKSGSTTGKSAIVETDEIFNIWSPLCILRSNKDLILPKFLFYCVQSRFFLNQVETSWSYGTQPNIGMGVIENLTLLLPPKNEQQLIVDILNNKLRNSNLLIEKNETKKNLLYEYRQSLISSVVTGKIQVTSNMI